MWGEEAEEEVGRGYKHCKMPLGTAFGSSMNHVVHPRVHHGLSYLSYVQVFTHWTSFQLLLQHRR